MQCSMDKKRLSATNNFTSASKTFTHSWPDDARLTLPQNRADGADEMPQRDDVAETQHRAWRV
eukprot:569367-Pleurochrysis_carterae.AAC.1